ncbi:DNA polymerase/3'-5' exonuclease PolX [Salinicoccus roseus]|uniref:DNA polymerase/3'-5' exonuclease PolX n=1 Tax=Salinicoccus roseus TaxID=45670 RepID=UPI000F4D8669|nr:DNA polymerase/3'-5' exonuclease PolX [Salinicoccus roseus]RPE53978.1 DNA polymerase (family 10) [Salinicoccus roseus]GGA69343.1 DNA polymerase/3'-5' exonuclease PolX [Salinicoccus roseus]
MTKKDIINLLETIATYMELSLENPFKVSAYRKAAGAIERDPRSLAEIDDFSEIKGIGKGVNEVITEYVGKGESSVLGELRESVPAPLIQMLKLPTLGPKKIAKLHKELGVVSLESLKAECEAGRVSELSGFGKKTEENISKAIDELLTRPERYPIEKVQQFRRLIEASFEDMEGISRYDNAGSARRFKETSRDLDFIVETRDAAGVTEKFIGLPFVKEVVAKGERKLSVVIEHDLDQIGVDIRFVTPEAYATTLHHFTGSKDHNVKMRQIAKTRGEKISEYGVEKDGGVLTFDSETDFFSHFDLPYIPPAMRETGEETDVDVSGIVTLEDIRGDLHMHTVYSDGAYSVREMVEACIAKGYEYMVITDHSKSLRVANGLDEARLRRQIEEIKALRPEYPEIDIYTGTEMDILKDGTLDFQDDMLEELDYVIAAIHSSFQQTEEEIMHRLQMACENPHVRHIAHPTGRLIGRREGYAVDMERLVQIAKDTGTVLEVNANPRRLDLSSDVIRNSGLMLMVNTDAHHSSHLDFMDYGVATLQKGLIEKNKVVNTLSREKFREWVQKGK